MPLIAKVANMDDPLGRGIFCVFSIDHDILGCIKIKKRKLASELSQPRNQSNSAMLDPALPIAM